MSKTLVLVFQAAIFFITENNYFGWNRLPQSDSELIADGIVMILIAFAVMSIKETT